MFLLHRRTSSEFSERSAPICIARLPYNPEQDRTYVPYREWRGHGTRCAPPNGTYLAIGLKSFHASVECADRGLDPFATDLVVADPTRSPNTICLAVTPSLKAKGVRNRCRIREIPQGIPYITAMPRMHRYMEVSAQVYAIYLRYVSSQDAWPYSVDEAFLDVTPYRAPYGSNARELAHRITSEV